jgi:hypothetical protein
MIAAIEFTLFIIGFICLIAAPVIILQKLEDIRAEKKHKHAPHTTPLGKHLIMNESPNEDQLACEDRRILLFENAIANAKSPGAVRLWTNKKAEYVLGLKWLNVVQAAPGSSDSRGTKRVYNTGNEEIIG